MKFTGSANIVVSEPRLIHDPLYGDTVELRYRGALAILQIWRATYNLAGYRTDLDPSENGSYGRLSVWLGADATQPVDVPLVDQWELEGDDVDISIYQSEALRDVTSTMTAVGRAQFRADVDSVFRGDLDPTEFLAGFTGAQLATVEDLLESIGLGIEVQPEARYVLRRTTILAANSTIKPSLANTNKLISTTNLVATQPIPATIKFDLPEGYWRKGTPRAAQTTVDKWTLRQDWSYQKTLYPLDQETET